MDEGNLGDEALSSRPGPFFDHNFHAHNHHHHHQLHHFHDDVSSAAASVSPTAPFDNRPSQIPVASYATANLQVFSANSHSHSHSNSQSRPGHGSPDTVDPDDFYRSYRGVQTSNGNTNGNANGHVDQMASATAASRQPPTLRSNGNGATAKHPSIPARPAPRPGGFRSVSNPVDDRFTNAAHRTANGYGPAAGTVPPSVKDLKKKFDQTASQPAVITRKAVGSPRTTRDTAPATTNGRTAGSSGSATSYATLRSSATRETAHETGKASGSRGGQRPRFMPEDHLSTNSQSFASRISKPRSAVSTNDQASKSATHLSPGASPELPTSPPASSRTNGLLFGEILPEEIDSVTVGFGIEGFRPRRTSDSNLQNPARQHQRSFSDPEVDMEPSSPTEWYRAAAVSGLQDVDGNESRAAKNHLRSQSDFAGSKLDYGAAGQRIDIMPLSPVSPTSPISPTSRLPILVKKLSDPSSHGSPGSTRSNSPATLRYSGASGRTSRQRATAATRAKTPTNRSKTPTVQAKTPAHTPGITRKPAPPNISTPSSSRLAAYVAVPTPKLSPTLRSSRPRQSVATATTTASRMKTVEGAPPLPKPAQRAAPKPDDASARRRKVSVGPIDFAQRRETIKLAYSKSIRDSQAREARKAAAEKRKKELEAVAKAKVEAEAVAMAAAAASAAAAADVVNSPASDSSRQLSEPKAQSDRIAADEPLKITTDMSLLSKPIEEPGAHRESPSLGIPGSFPSAGSPFLDQDTPQSAISTTTAITEFDPEEQTEPPRQESTAAIDHDLGIIMLGQSHVTVEPDSSKHPQPPPIHKKASYHYPFEEEEEHMDDENMSIKISLDTTEKSFPRLSPQPSLQPSLQPSPQPSPQLTPTRSDFELEPSLPVFAISQDEYEPQPYSFSSPNYETTVTILGPGVDFTPSYRDEPRTTLLAANLPQANDALPVAETHETIITNSDLATDKSQREKPRAELEKLERLEDFYIGVRLHDNIASLRHSTFAPSEPDVSYDAQQSSSAEYQNTPGTSHSLTVPALLAPANRLSQHSAWTDFSFGSDIDAGAAGSAPFPQDPEFHREAAASKLTASPVHLVSRESSLEDLPQSLQLSLLDNSGEPSPSMLANEPAATLHLPELDTGDGFSIPYLPDKNKIPALPDHSPPRPPVDDYQLDGSVYVVGTRPNSYLHSHDEREDLTTQAFPAAGSVGQLSLEPRVSISSTLVENKTLPAEAQAPWAEEQKRLRQRQLVIRELIDTEELFVRDMSVVEELYKGTAEACPKLDNKAIKLIFRNTDEVIAFHGTFLAQLKEGASSVYTPKGRRSPIFTQDSSKDSDTLTMNSTNSGGTTNKPELDDEKDRLTSIGPSFLRNIAQLKAVHEVYLRSSDMSSKRLIQIQEDETVMIWLNECNEMAKELTSAWNLDSLLIKPMQRITKYPDIITHLLKYTPADHPDRETLSNARSAVISAIDEINKTKKNFELVGQIVGTRKRKDSDVRAGIARAFGKRVDKLQTSNNRPSEDEEYTKLHEKFGDDYLHLQIILRDIEFYTRTVATYVHEFLQYLSSMELVMRLQPSREYAHLESKWVQFNVSMRDIEKIALERHLSDVRKHVIEPFEQVIKCYGNPSLAMKKRTKRRLDYEKYVQLKANGKKIDKQLSELVEQYEALNDTLKKELPKLSALTANIGNLCLGKFVNIQTSWYAIWKEKVKAPLQDVTHVPELSEIVSSFQREFSLQEERAMTIGILNPALRSRISQSTTDDASSIMSRTRSRPSDLRVRGHSLTSESAPPSLPTPDILKRNSGQFSVSSAASSTVPSPGLYYRDFYAGIASGHGRGSGSPVTPDLASSSRMAMSLSARPNTGKSFESSNMPRQSTESTAQYSGLLNRRDSNSTYNSNFLGPETRRLSGLFHSALPLPDNPEESQRSSRASSGERGAANSGYKVMWLAASLFEFNIETTKHEAGYPYLTYQAGEIFDVIAEKGELWLAKNQDDPSDLIGWIWSKHFAKLADS
ncbi:hypothetical protein B0H63DRAFT_385838 [Podospora didyma]|uniref:DH domain-containing protein n=1 Tax=Podospora didyma TaxID=330526 RepID=A0AAE0P790_9PEZI|nr:hypothetical protein B0H63DRAFT_385838 [Podospora didyma]